ncbi:hypothetical protein JL722_12624 [Aureococcus anophagefferens]|nr:hypothetical protein JL722_12624 [Aureococcus anophagefferens]
MARGYGSSPAAPAAAVPKRAQGRAGSVQAPSAPYQHAARVLEAWIVIAVGALCVMATTGVVLGYAPSSLQFARSFGAALPDAPRRARDYAASIVGRNHDQTRASGPNRTSSSDWLQTKNNLTKIAWAASDTDAAKKFFLRYSSSMAALDGCDPSCECGTQGRVMLNGTSGFGLHTVDAFTHPSGDLNVSAIEKVFTQKVVVEFVGSSQTSLDPAEIHEMDTPRYGGSLADYVVMPCCMMTPLWVSRATSDADRDWNWYSSKLNANLTFSADTPDGVKYRYGTMASSSAWEVHFVERPADAAGGMTVADLEAYFKETHAAYVHSPACGFDVWFDNHYGIDMCGGGNCMGMDDDDLDPESLYVDDLVERLESGPDGADTYRIWKQIWLDWGWLYNIYIVEPNGQSLQINGFLKHAPADTPQWNQSLCGQGTCQDWGWQRVD